MHEMPSLRQDRTAILFFVKVLQDMRPADRRAVVDWLSAQVDDMNKDAGTKLDADGLPARPEWHTASSLSAKVRRECPWCHELCAQSWCGRCERMLPDVQA